MANQPELTVRPATPDDVPQIMAFIRGIAEFEHLTHQVEATEDGLRETLFGDSPAAEALLGFFDDAPAGYAVYFHTYSTFLGRRGLYLEDIYVSPEYRRQGLGAMLMRRVAAIAVERAAAASSGRRWTGTPTRTASTRASARRCSRSGASSA